MKIKIPSFLSATAITLLIFALLAFPSCSNGSSSSESDSAPEPTSQAPETPEEQQLTIRGHGEVVDGEEFPVPRRSGGTWGLLATKLSDGYSVMGACPYPDFREFSFRLTPGTWQIDASINMVNFDEDNNPVKNIILRASQTITISDSSSNTSEIVLLFAPPQAAR